MLNLSPELMAKFINVGVRLTEEQKLVLATTMYHWEKANALLSQMDNDGDIDLEELKVHHTGLKDNLPAYTALLEQLGEQVAL